MDTAGHSILLYDTLNGWTATGTDTDTESGDHAESKPMYPGKGYWLYMTGDGEQAAIGM